MFVKAEEGWIFYAPFRLSSLLENTKDSWKILHQHGSFLDSKADEGEAFGFDELKVENKKLRDAIQSRTIELERKNRELEIKAALERVRARTMAMHKSDELGATSLLLFDEFKALDEISEQISIGIFDEENQVLNLYATVHGEQWKEATKIDLDEPHAMQKIYNGWREKKKSLLIDLSGKELKAYNKMVTWGDFERIDPNVPGEDDLRQIGGLTYVMARTMHGEIGYSLPGMVPHPPDEDIKTLQRFADTFDLAYRRFEDLKTAEEQVHKIQLVNEENERLLHSILPEQIVEQIRTKKETVVKRFEQVSILFADIVGFTILSEKLPPSKVVDILNGLFSKFDDLTDKYGLEKIKTIGDAYMVAAGVPEEKEDHAMTIFQFAQDMFLTLEEYNQTNNNQMKLRIGISSGPVVAGVIGKKKFAYDLWGDTVNTAARMEAYGQEGRIQVAPPCYELLKNDFEFERVPQVHIKGKGLMDVYLWKNEQGVV